MASINISALHKGKRSAAFGAGGVLDAVAEVEVVVDLDDVWVEVLSVVLSRELEVDVVARRVPVAPVAVSKFPELVAKGVVPRVKVEPLDVTTGGDAEVDVVLIVKVDPFDVMMG